MNEPLVSSVTYERHRIELKLLAGLPAVYYSGNNYMPGDLILQYVRGDDDMWQILRIDIVGHILKKNGTPGARVGNATYFAGKTKERVEARDVGMDTLNAPWPDWLFDAILRYWPKENA